MMLHFRWHRSYWLASAVPVALLSFLLSACAPQQSSGAQPGATTNPQGRLTGDVVAGPTCPVERAESPCPPAPVPGQQVMIKTADGRVVATTTTDQHGHFSISLAPGTYTVEVPPGTSRWPRQTQVVQITVLAGQTAYVKIELDTGIR